MITKQFRITIALLALTALASLPVWAGQVVKAQPEQKKTPLLVPAEGPLHLRCSVEKLAKAQIELLIFNQTARTIRRGTVISWQITQKVQGSFVLKHDVASGKSYRTSVQPTPPGTEFFFNPQPEPPIPVRAWYNPRQFVSP